jgi:hypothetical protein
MLYFNAFLYKYNLIYILPVNISRVTRNLPRCRELRQLISTLLLLCVVVKTDAAGYSQAGFQDGAKTSKYVSNEDAKHQSMSFNNFKKSLLRCPFSNNNF